MTKVPIVPRGDCWVYAGYLDRDGYGRVAHGGSSLLPHRLVYEALIGPIPPGLELDHLCRVRACVNPDHLEPVTHVENMRRSQVGAWQRAKTLCPQGHEYDQENTYHEPATGNRQCRVCRNLASARYRKRRKP